MSIETLVDLDNLSMEELTGRLKASEERFDLDSNEHGAGKLLLTEELCSLGWVSKEEDNGGSQCKLAGNNTLGDTLADGVPSDLICFLGCSFCFFVSK